MSSLRSRTSGAMESAGTGIESQGAQAAETKSLSDVRYVSGLLDRDVAEELASQFAYDVTEVNRNCSIIAESLASLRSEIPSDSARTNLCASYEALRRLRDDVLKPAFDSRNAANNRDRSTLGRRLDVLTKEFYSGIVREQRARLQEQGDQLQVPDELADEKFSKIYKDFYRLTTPEYRAQLQVPTELAEAREQYGELFAESLKITALLKKIEEVKQSILKFEEEEAARAAGQVVAAGSADSQSEGGTPSPGITQAVAEAVRDLSRALGYHKNCLI